jgi:hypothetical protein
MKRMAFTVLCILVTLVVAEPAPAVDIAALDRVSILMSKSEVLAILGPPHEINELRAGLKAEIYRLSDADPMVGAGCIYDKEQVLRGQAYLFSGSVGKESADRIKEAGFTVMEEKEGTFRLLGKDDDTGRPMVVYIFEAHGLTTVMTFEKDFYDQQVK